MGDQLLIQCLCSLVITTAKDIVGFAQHLWFVPLIAFWHNEMGIPMMHYACELVLKSGEQCPWTSAGCSNAVSEHQSH